MDLLQRISIDPAVRYGKPCVRGTLFTASVSSPQLLLERFPSSTHVRLMGPPRGPGLGDQR